MSLITQFNNFVTRAATEFKSVRSVLGNLANLTTTAKGDIVSAINEVKAGIGGAGANINDVTPSTVAVYSSSKTEAVAAAAAASAASTAAAGIVKDTAPDTAHAYSSDKVVALLAAQRAEITGTAGAALDTFGELAAQMVADEGAAASLAIAVGNRVRFDAAQTLTAPQKAQAIANIGAISAADIGDVTTDFVALFNAGLL